MVDFLASPWFWGLGGAFIYAAPNFSACLFNAKGLAGRHSKCFVDGSVAVTIGPIAAAAFTGTVQSYLDLDGGEHLPAIAALIGLLANPVAPKAIEILSGGLLKKAQKLVDGDGK